METAVNFIGSDSSALHFLQDANLATAKSEILVTTNALDSRLDVAELKPSFLDGTTQTLLDAETDSRVGGVTTLTTALGVERGRITAIVNLAANDMNTLVELTSHFASEDNDLAQAITALTNEHNTELQTQVDAFVAEKTVTSDARTALTNLISGKEDSLSVSEQIVIAADPFTSADYTNTSGLTNLLAAKQDDLSVQQLEVCDGDEFNSSLYTNTSFLTTLLAAKQDDLSVDQLAVCDADEFNSSLYTNTSELTTLLAAKMPASTTTINASQASSIVQHDTLLASKTVSQLGSLDTTSSIVALLAAKENLIQYGKEDGNTVQVDISGGLINGRLIGATGSGIETLSKNSVRNTLDVLTEPEIDAKDDVITAAQLVITNALDTAKQDKLDGSHLHLHSGGSLVGVGTSSPDGDSQMTVHGEGKYGSNGVLAISDSRTHAPGVGGGIQFKGSYSGTAPTIFGSIRTKKDNSTAGHYGAHLELGTRANGSGDVSVGLTVTSSQNVEIPGTLTVTGDINGVDLDDLAPKASPAFTNVPTSVTFPQSYSSTTISTTSFVHTAVAEAKVSPAFSGTPTCPTQTAGNDSTRLANTSFVTTAVAAGGSTQLMNFTSHTGNSSARPYYTLSGDSGSYYFSPPSTSGSNNSWIRLPDFGSAVGTFFHIYNGTYAQSYLYVSTYQHGQDGTTSDDQVIRKEYPSATAVQSQTDILFL